MTDANYAEYCLICLKKINSIEIYAKILITLKEVGREALSTRKVSVLYRRWQPSNWKVSHRIICDKFVEQEASSIEFAYTSMTKLENGL